MQRSETYKTKEQGKRNADSASFFSSSKKAGKNPFFPVSVHQHVPAGHGTIQLKPSYLVSHNFMGKSVEVNRTMQRRLRSVEADLQTQYSALPAPQPPTLADYAGLTSIRGWRANSGTSFHASGSAVDVNYRNQPYIATRSTTATGIVFGGEASGSSRTIRALRQPSVEVYDRASQFTNKMPWGLIAAGFAAMVPFFSASPQFIASVSDADVNERRSGESTSHAYGRFSAASDALSTYLSLAFLTNYDEVLRQPIANISTATEAQLLAAIPVSERKDEAVAIADITTFMNDPAWQAAHPGFTQTARDIFFQILRDYEHVRIPMVRGNPSTSPADTRNPALGFLNMPEHFVVAMADVGRLRWGAADLGAAESGDVHHFDLGTHAGLVPDPTP